MVRIEVSRGRRVCHRCKAEIPKATKVMLVWINNDYGSKEVGICKKCAKICVKNTKRNLDKEKEYLDAAIKLLK